MKILDIRDIDFNVLNMLDVFSSECTIYYDEQLIYKFYDDVSSLILERKKKKIILLNEGELFSDVVIPNILIQNGKLMNGCAMENIKDSKSLIKYRNSDIFILLLFTVSLSLKKIHNDPRNIVVGDLHFNNILIDNNRKHHFIDFDSCMIEGIIQDRLPRGLIEYISNRNNFDFDVSYKTDKLCMLLSTINALFGKEIDSVSLYEYDEKAEKIRTLKNMREIFLAVKDNSVGIPDVPYFSDFVSLNDFPGTKKIKNRAL